jgi:hypothetical protein
MKQILHESIRIVASPPKLKKKEQWVSSAMAAILQPPRLGASSIVPIG